jgi:hypothetical protein
LELFAIDLAKTLWQVYSFVHGRDYLILARDGPLRSTKESGERDTEKVVIVLLFFSDSVENLPRQKTG